LKLRSVAGSFGDAAVNLTSMGMIPRALSTMKSISAPAALRQYLTDSEEKHPDRVDHIAFSTA